MIDSGLSSLHSGLGHFHGILPSTTLPSEWVSPVETTKDATTVQAGKVITVSLNPQDWTWNTVAQDAVEIKVFEATHPTLKQLTNFSDMQDGWDLEDITPISDPVLEMAAEQVIEFAWLAILKNGLDAEIVMPDVLPTARGSIQFEWHHKNMDLEIELFPSGQRHAFLERENQLPVELDVSSGFDEIELELSNLLTS